MLRLRRVTETFDMKVFTEEGDYFGDIDEPLITSNRISGWKVRATKNSFLARVLGSLKGVIVPHSLVRSIGDIMIISKTAVPSTKEE